MVPEPPAVRVLLMVSVPFAFNWILPLAAVLIAPETVKGPLAVRVSVLEPREVVPIVKVPPFKETALLPELLKETAPVKLLLF